MSTNLRIHIVAVGFEFRRVTEPLIRMQADKVYLITYAKDDAASNFYSAIKNELAQNYKHIMVEEVFLNIWNLYDCIEKFREIILKEKGNHIYVNVSTGTKISAIAGMLSCMMWNTNPYYAPVTFVGRKKLIQPSELVEDSNMLPTYEIKKPKPEYMLILNLIQDHKGVMRKSKMIEKLSEQGIIRKEDEHGHELKGPAMHSQLRSLLDPMEREWKLIRIEASGRRSEVFLTEQGQTTLRYFGCETTNKKLVSLN